MSGLGLEQPPVDDPIRLAEWLTRMMNQIDAELERVWDMEPTGILPNKIQNGMVRYFVAGTPTIPTEGPYVVVNGVWTPMT